MNRGCIVTSRCLQYSVVRVLAIAVAIALVPTVGFAQLTRGAISGTIKDTSGGVVPGATITITHNETNATREAVTDERGTFRVGALEPGLYKVTAQLAGFATVEQPNIDVRTSTEISLDFELKAAAVSEVIVVQAQTAALNRVDPTISTTISARRVVEMPLAGERNINNLIADSSERGPTTRPGHLCDQRAALAQQQLHDRRLRQQRHLGHHLDVAGRARGGGRVPGADESIQRRVRPQHRRRRST